MSNKSNAKNIKKNATVADVNKNLKLASKAMLSGKLSYGEAAEKFGFARSTMYNLSVKLAAAAIAAKRAK